MSLLLLDTASLYFRAYFGVPRINAADGVRPVNAVRGLLDFTAKFIRETHPEQLAACWDNDWRPAWRVALLPSYKSHRVAGDPPAAVSAELPIGAGGRGAQSGEAEIADDDLAIQVPMISAVLDAAGIAMVGADGYEADDVIGSLATQRPGPVNVVTGDRDLFQLVNDRVRLLYVARGISKYETVDDQWLAAKYGIVGAQYVDFAVLRGDPSDGLPGVPGIGEKTAASLLARYGDLDAATAAPDLSGSVASKLAAHTDYIERAQQVVAVRRDLTVPGDLSLPREPADPARLNELAEELNLGGSLTRLLEAMATR